MNQGYKLTEAQKLKVVELFNKNHGADTIARLIGCPSHSPVKKYMDEMGLKRTISEYYEIRRTNKNVELGVERLSLVKQLFESGATITRIKRETLLTHRQVNNCIKSMGLKRSEEHLKKFAVSRGSGVSIYNCE